MVAGLCLFAGVMGDRCGAEQMILVGCVGNGLGNENTHPTAKFGSTCQV
jgi:hypothetical protein